MGSKKSVTIGYRYFMDLHIGLGRGPVDELVEIEAGGKTAWKGSVTSSQQTTINKPSLFGGEKKEGGLQGPLWVMMGEPTQTAPSKLASMLGGDVPGFRGVATLFYSGLVSAMNPYLKPWKMRVRRYSAGWDGAPWYPEKAKIELSAGAIHAMNPAHIVYECLTNRQWGGGLDRSRLDDVSFRAAADQLAAEGFGLCLRWTRQDSVSNFVQTVLDHIGGNLYLSRFDGTFHLTLIRDDYVAADLPLFDEDSGLLGIDEDENAASSGAANELIIKWHDPIKDQGRQWRERNLAAIQADGQTLSTTQDYPGLPTIELAGRVAVRELRQRSSSLKRFKVRLDRRGYKIEPGQAFRIRSLKRGIDSLVVRAGRIEDGTLADSAITISAVQDVFGLPATSISSVQASGWVAPDPTPQAASVRRLTERTWRDLAQTTDAANLALIDPTASYLSALAVKPSSLSLAYALQTRVGSAAWYEQDEGDFCPSGLLTAPLGQGDTAFTLTSGTDLDFVEVGGLALLGDELVRVDSFDPITLSGHLGRGCVDTVPAAHAAGARLWFLEDGGSADPAAYSPGTTVQARMLTQTSQGQIDPALVATDSLTMAQRQGRPYPPGQVKINGSAWPESLSGDLTLTWAHRDRLLQADQLVDALQGSIGPEPGVTYAARLLRADNQSVLVNQASISGLTALLETTYEGQVIAELWSVRDGLESWQRWRHILELVAVPPIIPNWSADADVVGSLLAANSAYAGTAATASRTTLGYGWSSHMGGVLAPSGKIYCMPSYVSSMAVIDPAAGTVEAVPGVGTGLINEFMGGVLAPNGKIYGIPGASTSVLVINPSTNGSKRLAMGLALSAGITRWFGGVLGGDGKIYGVPWSSDQVLIIDPNSDTAVLENFGLSLAGSGSWLGGARGADGKLYFCPFNAPDILVIDPAAGTATRTAMGANLSGSSKWAGMAAGADGKLYCVPYDAPDFLVIDPAAGTATRTALGADLSGSGKWEGLVQSPDGKLYGIPRNAADILIVNPVAGTATRSALGASLGGDNKWYNGVLAANGKIYGIPGGSGDALVITPAAGVPALPIEVCTSPLVNQF